MPEKRQRNPTPNTDRYRTYVEFHFVLSNLLLEFIKVPLSPDYERLDRGQPFTDDPEEPEDYRPHGVAVEFVEIPPLSVMPRG